MMFTKVPTSELSLWRRVAPHMWRRPDYPCAYGIMEIDVSDTLRAVAQLRAGADVPVTVNHVAVKAIATALAAVPEANCAVMRWGIYRRPTIDIFVLIALENGRDLMGTTLHEVDRMSVLDIARTLYREAAKLRAGKAGGAADARETAQHIPAFLRRSLTRVSDFFVHEVGLDLSRLGVPPNQFGSTSVSFMGSFEGSGPLIGLPPLMMPLARLALALSVGRTFPRPVAVGNRVAVRPVLPVGAVVDHRLLDGAQVSQLAGVFRRTLEDPWALVELPAERGAEVS